MSKRKKRRGQHAGGVNSEIDLGQICRVCEAVKWHKDDCEAKDNSELMDYSVFCRQKTVQAKLPVNLFNYAKLVGMLKTDLRKMLWGLRQFHDWTKPKVNRANKGDLATKIREALETQDKQRRESETK